MTKSRIVDIGTFRICQYSESHLNFKQLKRFVYLEGTYGHIVPVMERDQGRRPGP